MNRKNTMEPRIYLVRHVYWSVISMLWYRSLCFRCVLNLSYTESKLILWMLYALSVLIGVAVTYKMRRNRTSLAVNVLLPFGLYATLAYYAYLQKMITIIYITAGILSLAYFLAILLRRIPATRNRRSAMGKRLQQCLHGSRTIVAFCLAILVFSIGIKTVFGYQLFSAKESTTNALSSGEYTIAENIETVCKLDEHTWASLDIQERLNVLQVIANIESNYLGIPHAINVEAGNMEESTWGYYSDRNRKIVVNIDRLSVGTAHEILDVLCHEAYHAYQHRLVDLYDKQSEQDKELLLFYNASRYQQEFADYSDEDYFEYTYQTCEVACRLYAERAVEDYYQAIDEHAGETSS